MIKAGNNPVIIKQQYSNTKSTESFHDKSSDNTKWTVPSLVRLQNGTWLELEKDNLEGQDG